MKLYQFYKRSVLCEVGGDDTAWSTRGMVLIAHRAWTQIGGGSLLHETFDQFENELGALMHQEMYEP